ncbi:PIR protein [Plasmodium yoelii]|uniref:PIR protein n=2 Tax=Plasmodium yoelii TaxID=5861 RepID=A0AAE9WLE9_PLAYO|nr:PIR protein [Plasmodium yoelii]WBY55116.1 PIR protein [Plasmodium yoelii yoelii]CDU16369.1 YIR protein [Plasmodium yoelii]VTZ72695.1 PIR protein [Plasmodium yoelii]|eukprot:XP_022811498.1 PIR protein [Plasmodium yoelii]
MDDTLCGKIDFLREYIPDELSKTAQLELEDNNNFKNYCPITDSGKNECNNDLDKITAGFLWLLGECYATIISKSYNEDNTNTFFQYIISWLSYKLNKSTENYYTKINDFYTKHVINSGKYNTFTNIAYKFTELKEFLEEQNDLLNSNIEDMSKFYDAFKLLCSMYGNIAQNEKGTPLSNNATMFVNKYTELNNEYNIEDSAHSKILFVLSTEYDNLKNKCNNCTPLPDITSSISAQTYRITSSSLSTGNKLFTVLSIFGAIAFFLGISYKYSLFGFRKRFQKQKLREKLKNIKKRMNH